MADEAFKRDDRLFDYTPPDKGFHSEETQWGLSDKLMEALFGVMMLGDERQTEQIARNAGKGGLHETNMFLGEDPSKARIRAYFAGTMLLHWALMNQTPKPFRQILQGLSLGVEQQPIRNNLKNDLDLYR